MWGYPVFTVPTVAPELTPGVAVNPQVGLASFPERPFCVLYVGILKQWCSTVDTWQSTIHVGRCDARRAWQNHHVSQCPMGCYYAVEVTGPEAIMTMILN
jgi:hypothetical protein